MGTYLEPSDLAPFAEIDSAKAEIMIEDAEAMAVLAAPCLGSDPTTLTAAQKAAVKAVLRGAILRWNEAGTGVRQSVTTGPFGETLDTTQQRRGMYWPTEITQLQDICGSGSVYTTSLAGPDPVTGTYDWLGWH